MGLGIGHPVSQSVGDGDGDSDCHSDCVPQSIPRPEIIQIGPAVVGGGRPRESGQPGGLTGLEERSQCPSASAKLVC